ncbi:MAG: hypothetical protein C0621_07090 [Desulfuromonas sp.]|nr:MAG: hypothetical protein C0621_07090 [Desulfuromonas sp.]
MWGEGMRRKKGSQPHHKVVSGTNQNHVLQLRSAVYTFFCKIAKKKDHPMGWPLNVQKSQEGRGA